MVVSASLKSTSAGLSQHYRPPLARGPSLLCGCFGDGFGCWGGKSARAALIGDGWGEEVAMASPCQQAAQPTSPHTGTSTVREMTKDTYVRQASHSGSWYTKSSETLDSQLTCWLSEASTASLLTPRKGSVRALIAPHAGYSFSGPTAAYAYMHLDPTLIRRIFILGPSHHVHLKACALSGASVCATPVGDLTVDEAVRAELLASPLFQRMTQGIDEDEHSIEMHLPYVAHRIRATQGITIVPVMVGALDPAQEAEYGRYVCYYARKSRGYLLR